MGKLLRQLAISLLILGAAWYGLSRFDFRKNLKIETLSQQQEEKLSDLIISTVRLDSKELETDTIKAVLQEMMQRLCDSNGLDAKKYQLLVFEQFDPNAFAIPGNTIILHSSMITFAETPEELLGVIAHEIGHIEKNHIMQRLAREIGFSILLTMAGGNSTGDINRQVLKVLGSSAYDREQEKEADLFAVEAMAKANMDPEHLANLFARFHEESPGSFWIFDKISSHPNSMDRASYILETRKEMKIKTSPLLDADWEELKYVLVGEAP
jgi:beta-barrel assembly-enhancing protease